MQTQRVPTPRFRRAFVSAVMTKKPDKDAELEAMRRAYEKNKEAADRRGSGSDDWKERTLELKIGSNVLFFLPRPGSAQFYTEALTHFKQGPDGKRVVRCIGELNDKGRPIDGTKCPICRKFLSEQEYVNGKYPRGSEDGKAAWKRIAQKYLPNMRYYANVLTSEGEVKLLPYGPQIQEQLMAYFFETDSEVGNFTDLREGRWMNVRCKSKLDERGKKSRNTKYEVRPSDTQNLLERELSKTGKRRPSIWKQVKPLLHDLDAAAGKILTKDEILAIMRGTSGDGERSERKRRDDDVDDRDDRRERRDDRDRDRARGREHRTKTEGRFGTGSRRRDDDSSDDGEGDSDDDDDEGERRGRGGEGDDDVDHLRADKHDVDEKPRTKVKGSRPACHGDPDEHDPEDDTCQDCAHFDTCKETPAVAERHYVKLHKSKKHADEARTKR